MDLNQKLELIKTKTLELSALEDEVKDKYIAKGKTPEEMEYLEEQVDRVLAYLDREIAAATLQLNK